MPLQMKHDLAQQRIDLYDEEGTHLGEIEYSDNGESQLLATHTMVYPQFEGKGYAGMLVDALAAYAKEKKVTIIPVCSYVKRMFQVYPEKYAAVIGTLLM